MPEPDRCDRGDREDRGAHADRGEREWIPNEEWETIVRHVPIVSVDLVVRFENRVILGERENEPAKGEWFVPGGRVNKHEQLTDAVHRVARTELGVGVEIETSLGAYQHFYEIADVAGVGGKHYVANGFVVRAGSDPTAADGQHSDLRAFAAVPADLHPYVAQYLQDAGVIASE